MSFSLPAYKVFLRPADKSPNPPALRRLPLSIGLLALLLIFSTSFEVLPASGQALTPSGQAHAANCHLASADDALPFSDKVFLDYQHSDYSIPPTNPTSYDP